MKEVVAALKAASDAIKQVDENAIKRHADVMRVVMVLGGAAKALMESHPDPDALRSAWAAYAAPVDAFLPEDAQAARLLLAELEAALPKSKAH